MRLFFGKVGVYAVIQHKLQLVCIDVHADSIIVFSDRPGSFVLPFVLSSLCVTGSVLLLDSTTRRA